MWSRAPTPEPDEMKTPLLLVLVWSLADGAVVSKCDLRDKLVKTIGNLTVTSRGKQLAGDNLVAKFVCHAQLASGFNTSLVKDLVAKSYRGQLNLMWPHTRKRRNSRELSHNPGRRAAGQPDGTFYGIFQLSSRLVCSDGTTPSPTVCGLACSKLVDDDIGDDIRCLIRVFTIPGNSGLGAAQQEELNDMIGLILQPRCSVVQPSVYFVNCPLP